MDRALPLRHRRTRFARQTAIALAAVTGLVSLVALSAAWLRPSVSRSRIRTARVEVGPVEAMITTSGTVVPEVEQVVPSPVDARVLKIRKRPGDTVTPGEPLLELDLAASRLTLERLEHDLAIKENMQARTRLDLDARLDDLAGQQELRRLQLASARAQLSRDRQLHDRGFLSQDELSRTELAEAQAGVELRKTESETRHAERSTRAQIEGLRLETATLRGERDEARRQLELATTKADRRGVLTWIVTEEGAEVRKGEVIARLADLGSFRVDATTSDVHAQRLAAGLPVLVKINDLQQLRGHISHIHPAIKQGVLTFSVALDDRASPWLRANLRVDVLVVTGHRDHTVRVARGPFADGEGNREVFVVRGDRAVRTTARFGLTSAGPLRGAVGPGARRRGDHLRHERPPGPARARHPLTDRRPTPKTNEERTMIRLTGVEKLYRTDRIETVALAEVNLTVREGEFVSIMGPSGCGKSTLLNIMGLLDAPSRGTVELAGAAVDSYDDRHWPGCATRPSASSSRAST
jgi:HlyD family secretion protein